MTALLADRRSRKYNYFFLQFLQNEVHNSFMFTLDFRFLTYTATRVICGQIPVKGFTPVTQGSLYVCQAAAGALKQQIRNLRIVSSKDCFFFQIQYMVLNRGGNEPKKKKNPFRNSLLFFFLCEMEGSLFSFILIAFTMSEKKTSF